MVAAVSADRAASSFETGVATIFQFERLRPRLARSRSANSVGSCSTLAPFCQNGPRMLLRIFACAGGGLRRDDVPDSEG